MMIPLLVLCLVANLVLVLLLRLSSLLLLLSLVVLLLLLSSLLLLLVKSFGNDNADNDNSSVALSVNNGNVSCSIKFILSIQSFGLVIVWAALLISICILLKRL